MIVVIVAEQTQSVAFDGTTRTEARRLCLYVEYVEGGTVDRADVAQLPGRALHYPFSTRGGDPLRTQMGNVKHRQGFGFRG